jgi:hypothetical protein
METPFPVFDSASTWIKEFDPSTATLAEVAVFKANTALLFSEMSTLLKAVGDMMPKL